MDHTIEYIMIGIYLIFLISIGCAFSRLNKNLSDYVRGGAQGEWWLIGGSMLMASTSAFTFTGNAGAAYEAGLSPLVIYLAGTLSYIILWLFLAAWFRQTRAITFQDIIRQRFGPEVEQINAWQAVIMGPISSAVQLWALAVFMSSVFALPLAATIVTIGVVVVLYSTVGGRWAVMATDFFQSLILIPITVILAVFCIIHIGGLGDFISKFSDPSVAEDYQLIQDPGHWPGDRFTQKWMIVIFISSFLGNISFTSAPHFLSARDGREARHAALLVLVVGACGVLIWMIPAWTSRFLFANEVNSMAIDNPATTAYAVAAQQMLPQGLLGLLIVGMFAATMSSMDTGLNGITGTIVRNILPALLRVLKRSPLKGTAELFICKIVTILLGVIIITYSLLLAMHSGIELFDIYFVFAGIIGLPLTVPFIASLFIKKLPRWSYFGIAGAAIVPSFVAWIDGMVNGNEWTIQDRIMWILIASAIGTAICRPFYRFSSDRYKNQVDTFFAQMRKPVNFTEEIGRSKGALQMSIMGNFVIAWSVALCGLFLLPNNNLARWAIALMVAFVLTIGITLKFCGKARMRREAENPELITEITS